MSELSGVRAITASNIGIAKNIIAVDRLWHTRAEVGLNNDNLWLLSYMKTLAQANPSKPTTVRKCDYDYAILRSMLQVEIVKQPDGTGVLRCTRPDGSVTWQKQTKHAAHFALHDLTHFAVETALGYRRGFFGLIAEGWDVEDTTGKGTRGALPAEAGDVEQIVGLFDSERASGTMWSAEEFNRFAPLTLTDSEIQNVRALRSTVVP